MTLNVPLNHLGGHLVSHCADEVPVFPELPPPQPRPKLGELLEQLAGRDALEDSYHLGDGVPRREGEAEVDMIYCNLLCLDLEAKVLRNTRKEQSQTLTHFIAHPFAVFRHSDKMVLGVVDGMTGPFESHASSITDFIGLWPIGLFLPAQRAGHPSPHSRDVKTDLPEAPRAAPVVGSP